MPTERKHKDGEDGYHSDYDPNDSSATTLGNYGRISVTHRKTPS
jgi:hypothetical protein